MLTPRHRISIYKGSETCARQSDFDLLKRQKNLIWKIRAPITMTGAAKSGDLRLSSESVVPFTIA